MTRVQRTSSATGIECLECGRRIATDDDAATCNTGECGCSVARSLCWRLYADDKCVPFSPYDFKSKRYEEGAAAAFGLMGMAFAIQAGRGERHFDPLTCIHGLFLREHCQACEDLENQELFV